MFAVKIEENICSFYLKTIFKGSDDMFQGLTKKDMIESILSAAGIAAALYFLSVGVLVMLR